MYRQTIETEYTVGDGVIQNPGKYEGEMLYAPHFYECSNDGEFLCGLDDGEYVALVEIDIEDRAQFPELDADTTWIKVRESEQGFVTVTELTDALADKVRALYAQRVNLAPMRPRGDKTMSDNEIYGMKLRVDGLTRRMSKLPADDPKRQEMVLKIAQLQTILETDAR